MRAHAFKAIKFVKGHKKITHSLISLFILLLIVGASQAYQSYSQRYLRLAETYLELGEPQKAIDSYKEHILRYPRDESARLELAELLYAKKKFAFF